MPARPPYTVLPRPCSKPMPRPPSVKRSSPEDAHCLCKARRTSCKLQYLLDFLAHPSLGLAGYARRRTLRAGFRAPADLALIGEDLAGGIGFHHLIETGCGRSRCANWRSLGRWWRSHLLRRRRNRRQPGRVRKAGPSGDQDRNEGRGGAPPNRGRRCRCAHWAAPRAKRHNLGRCNRRHSR